MKHVISAEDARFRDDFMAGRIPAARFNHRAHLRLAYIFLCEETVDNACRLMREAIQRFLGVNGVDANKYHETLTRAWIMALKHFMMNDSPARSFDEFVMHNPRMLDSEIMMTHYSRDRLFSPRARATFVDPDIDPIPRYN